MKAQQAAIKEEASANNLSDTSQEAQAIQEAKKEAQAETDKSADVSNEESKASTLNVSKEESQAERLANAAKQKQAKLTPGSKESQLTEALFAEKPVAKNDLKEIPLLVTKRMMYQKQLIQIIKTLLNKKKLNLKMVLLHVKLMKNT